MQSCDVNEYLNYSDCKCRKKLTDKLIDECIETTEKIKLVNVTENENNYECGSCIVYIVLIIVVFTVFTGMTVRLVYYNQYLINNHNNHNDHNNHHYNNNEDDDDDNHNKNKSLMNIIIKNGHNKINK